MNKPIGKEKIHNFIKYKDFSYKICSYCGIVQRRDKKQSECIGKVKISLR